MGAMDLMGTLTGLGTQILTAHIWGEVYIETGVSEGTSMAVALSFPSPPFLRLHGIEIDPAMVECSRKRFANDQRLTIHPGSSLDILPKIIDPNRSTVFWLDAHYDGAKQTSFDPRHGQCVLLEELRIIAQTPWQKWPVVLIDDSSTFCSNVWWERGAHGHGMDRAQNPTFQQIYDVLGGVNNEYEFLFRNQCIFCLPAGRLGDWV